MGHDLFDVRITSLSGDTITLEVLTGTAGGVDDFCDSRSFALSLLGHAQRGKGTPLERALLAAGGPWETSDWYVSEAWMRAHVGHFVVSTSHVARSPARRRNTLLKVVMTEPQWLVGLEVGQAFGTTAYDVWIEREAVEPSRDVAPMLAALDAALGALTPGAVVEAVAPQEGHVVLARRVTWASLDTHHALQIQLQSDGSDLFVEARCHVGEGDASRLEAALRLRKNVPGRAFLAQEKGNLFACGFVFARLSEASMLQALREVLALAASSEARALVA